MKYMMYVYHEKITFEIKIHNKPFFETIICILFSIFLKIYNNKLYD